MSDPSAEKRYTLAEEIASAVSHGLGAILAVAALILLVHRSLHNAPAPFQASYLAGCIVFGVSLIVLYLSSTLYHALTHPTAKRVFGILDHGSIYLLIAGTYSAYCLTVLHGRLGWTIFTVIWALAVAGISCYAVFGARMRKLSAVSYIPMGLLIVLWAKPVKTRLLAASGQLDNWHLLLLGGACYIGGMVFYAMKKVRWTHAVWHLFVLAGSSLHFLSVYRSI